jgi:hypothetical protein
VEAHWADLQRSGLSIDTIMAARIHSGSPAEVEAILGYGTGPGMVIPYPSENGGPSYARVRIDNPGLDGKRYRSPKDSRNRLYIPPTLDRKLLADPTAPLYITEGEKKALKAVQEGLPCIALSGVWSWRATVGKDGTKGPLPEFDGLVLRGRVVFIVYDSDLATNEKVQRAEAALADELRRRGATVSRIPLPAGPDGAKVGLDDYLVTHSVEAFCSIEPEAITADTDTTAAPAPYIETITAFLSEEDPPLDYVFPDLLPRGVIMLLHGTPRARKSLVAFELALSAATGTAPFCLARFAPAGPTTVLYVQEEDPRPLTRPRLRALVRTRCGDTPPGTLHVAVRRGIDLDDPVWVQRLVADLQRLGVTLLVLDAARRLSAKTDEGPGKVRELIAVLRSIVATAGVTIVIVHHDVKPQTNSQDQRRRGQRASGGDWFAGCECPVHVERLSVRESLVFPEDYKFSADPDPFTVACTVEDKLVTRLVGTDTTPENAERAGVRGKVLDWLKANGPASKDAMRKGLGGRWETIEAAVDSLLKEGRIDAGPGRKKGSFRYFVT